MFNDFARYEQAFADWRRDGYPCTKPQTHKYIDFLTDPNDDLEPPLRTLWPHQRESFLYWVRREACKALYRTNPALLREFVLR